MTKFLFATTNAETARILCILTLKYRRTLGSLVGRCDLMTTYRFQVVLPSHDVQEISVEADDPYRAKSMLQAQYGREAVGLQVPTPSSESSWRPGDLSAFLAVLVAILTYLSLAGLGFSSIWAGILAFAALCATIWSCVALVIGVIMWGVIFLIAHFANS